MRVRPLLYFIPILVLGLVIYFLAKTLRGEQVVAGMDAPMPALVAEDFLNQGRLIDLSILEGKPFLVNFFASWCGPCALEHHALVALAEEHHIPIIGVVYRDSYENIQTLLRNMGNPYQMIAMDMVGTLGQEWGLRGIPETFVIGSDGRIKQHIVGPLDQGRIREQILPYFKKK